MTNEEITLQELLFRQHFATTFAILQYSALFHVASKKFSEADSGGIIRLIIVSIYVKPPLNKARKEILMPFT